MTRTARSETFTQVVIPLVMSVTAAALFKHIHPRPGPVPDFGDGFAAVTLAADIREVAKGHHGSADMDPTTPKTPPATPKPAVHSKALTSWDLSCARAQRAGHPPYQSLVWAAPTYRCLRS